MGIVLSKNEYGISYMEIDAYIWMVEFKSAAEIRSHTSEYADVLRKSRGPLKKLKMAQLV